MLVPKLRFKEFTDEWKNSKLANVSKIFKGNGLSKSDLTADGKDCILYGELYTNYTEIIKVINSKTKKDTKSFILSKYNDIIIPASGETPIDIAKAYCILKDNVILGSDLNVIRLNDIDGRFLSYEINSKLRLELANLSQGHSIVHLYGEKFKNIEIKFPCKEEQNKIASMLELLSKKIELQSKKVEALKLYKKYIENTIFNFGSVVKTQTYLLKDVLEEGNKVSVNDTSKYNKITIKLNLNGLEFNNLKREMVDTRPFYIREENEIIIGKQNYFNGSIAIVTPKFAGSICSNAIMSFKVKSGFDVNYIYSYLSQKNYMKKKSYLANGTGQQELSVKDFLKFDIIIPEQACVNKINNVLNFLKLKMEKESIKYELLNQLKKGLMQNMFV